MRASAVVTVAPSASRDNRRNTAHKCARTRAAGECLFGITTDTTCCQRCGGWCWYRKSKSTQPTRTKLRLCVCSADDDPCLLLLERDFELDLPDFLLLWLWDNQHTRNKRSQHSLLLRQRTQRRARGWHQHAGAPLCKTRDVLILLLLLFALAGLGW